MTKLSVLSLNRMENGMAARDAAEPGETLVGESLANESHFAYLAQGRIALSIRARPKEDDVCPGGEVFRSPAKFVAPGAVLVHFIFSRP